MIASRLNFRLSLYCHHQNLPPLLLLMSWLSMYGSKRYLAEAHLLPCDWHVILQLTELALTMPVHRSGWLGLEKIPYTWSHLTNLQRLTLRGHLQLIELPTYFSHFQLRVLDIASCPQLNLNAVESFTSLETLMLQVLVILLNALRHCQSLPYITARGSLAYRLCCSNKLDCMNRKFGQL